MCHVKSGQLHGVEAQTNDVEVYKPRTLGTRLMEALGSVKNLHCRARSTKLT